MPTQLFGVPVADVRYLFPDEPGEKCSYSHPAEDIIGIAGHHDGILMPPGDQNYNGSTLDEDMARLNAIYRYNYYRLGGFPYHLVASPNGRLFQTRLLDSWGAHVFSRNDELLGFAIMGNYEEAEPPAEALCAASLGLIALWRSIGRLVAVKGHHEWAVTEEPTACPGYGLWLPKVLDFAAFNAKRFPWAA